MHRLIHEKSNESFQKAFESCIYYTVAERIVSHSSFIQHIDGVIWYHVTLVVKQM